MLVGRRQRPRTCASLLLLLHSGKAELRSELYRTSPNPKITEKATTKPIHLKMASVMAVQDQEHQHPQPLFEKLFSSYLGLSFTLFLGHLPRQAISLVSRLQTHNKELTFQLIDTEEELKQLLWRRKEDSKANARVVEIFASHRHAWQQEERRLLQQIEEGDEEIARLRGRVEELEKSEAELKENLEEMKREISERDEMLNFMSSCSGRSPPSSFASCENGDGDPHSEMGLRFGKLGGVSEGLESIGFNPEFLNSASKFWPERASPWQDMKYDSHESLYHLKHFVARREAPWKVDGESTGVSSKLKLLEQELLILERIGKTDLSKVPSLMRKQAKRYQALSGQIDDLCRRMQASDPSEPTLSSEFRSQRQTEFLLEALRLKKCASETGQMLLMLQTETGKGCYGDEIDSQAKLSTKRSFDSIRNNFREIQRNLEIWLARIMGDLEGVLARDGVSRARDYYISRYPFVQ
ncbi:PREDICTED: uncharacterized protein LOC109177219 [Ipomoea nil]|uniref:uncharacterized protein LOC109177219 n=1 Tax=Ipomoea nil TaxID=35883 RepID=UPI000901F913|nr:PREDICTED: uncharacterized protein LOC109177219 [Ipomoea nil]